jgi:hypothetical protein
MIDAAVRLDTDPQETTMDFIERIFGFSPDGGDGSFEFMLFAIPIAGIVYLLVRRRRSRRRQESDTSRRGP